MVRNEKVYQHVSERMDAEGFQRTSKQCNIKRKKLRSDYRKVKNQKPKGINQKNWKWFDMMDAVYGHRPASLGRGGGIDMAISLLESVMESAVEDPSSQKETTESLDKRLSTCESSSLSSPARTLTPTPPESVPSPPNVPRCKHISPGRDAGS
ncbi:zinc finger and SCAN domain-containing protein 29-like [Sinocyclocheilus grahami]|uniref:zinc finger and SCAN domain-containing protein 29-like n=1 Tax=Sinocyclocheilus grahami TaxID=75366 RepID=UPI0007AC8C95|nr:PREDICTED: zinc finger and SCAN domain-containing protein 29-like [Sinocyclocheilus grahami]